MLDETLKPRHRYQDIPLVTEEEITELSFNTGVRLLKRKRLDNSGLFDQENTRDFFYNFFYRYLDTDGVALIDESGWDSELRLEVNQLLDNAASLLGVCDSAIAHLQSIEAPDATTRWLEDLAPVHARLATQSPQVVVLGIEGSGKSSLINLLADEALLPEGGSLNDNENSNTRHRPESARLRMDDCLKETTDLDDCTVSRRWRRVLDKAVHKGRRKAETVDVASLVKLLGDSVSFVEFPSLKDTVEARQKLTSHLSTSTAVIFVLSSHEVNRVLGPEVVRLIDIVKETFGTSADRNVIFLFNHWDQILADHRKESNKRRGQYLDDLKALWPSAVVDRNVFFVCLRSTLCSKVSDAVVLRKAVSNVVINALRAHNEVAYKVLSSVLTEMQRLTRQRLAEVVVEADKHEAKCRDLFALIQRLPQTNDYVEELVTGIDGEFEKLKKELEAFLTSEDGLKALTAIEEDEIPNVEKYADLITEIQKLFFKQMIKTVEVWNRQEVRMVSVSDIINEELHRRTQEAADQIKIRNFFMKIIKLCLDKFKTLEEETQILTDHFRDSQHESTLKNDNFPPFSNVEVVVLFSTAIVWFPLAITSAAILSPFLIGKKCYDLASEREQMATYENDRREYLESEMKRLVHKEGSQVSSNLLEPILETCEKLKAELESYAKKGKAKIEKLVTDFNTDDKLKKAKAQLRDLLKGIDENMNELLTYHYSIEKVYEFTKDEFESNFSLNDLNSELTKRSFCSSIGKNAAILRGKSLKSFDGARVSQSNELWWKMLSFTGHCNVLNFYGLIKLPTSVGFVCESYNGNLRTFFREKKGREGFHLSDSDFRQSANDFLLKRTIDFAEQVLSAAQFVHKHNLVFTELCPLHVFYTESMQKYCLKFVYFGLPNELTSESFRCEESRLYASPETLNQGICTEESNLFTIGLILWELFYMKEFFTFARVNEDLDPKVIKESIGSDMGTYAILTEVGDPRFPEFYRQMITACFERIPSKRRRASDLLQQLFSVVKANCKVSSMTVGR